MAVLRVAREFLRDKIFEGVVSDVEITGASFDAESGEVLLSIVGAPVPDVKEVVAVVRQATLGGWASRITEVTFREVGSGAGSIDII